MHQGVRATHHMCSSYAPRVFELRTTVFGLRTNRVAPSRTGFALRPLRVQLPVRFALPGQLWLFLAINNRDFRQPQVLVFETL